MIPGIDWLTIASALAKGALGWCKRNWKFLLGLSIPIILAILLSMCDTGDEKTLWDIIKGKDEEIEIIHDAGGKLDAAIAEAEQRHQDRVEEIKQAHEEAQIELTEEKEEAIEKLVEEHGDDVDVLTQELSRTLGIDIVWDKETQKN